MNGFARGVVLAACLGLAVVVSATAAPPQKMIRIEKVNRLFISVREHLRGLEVTDVAANSPATRMTSTRNRNVTCRLEEGDVITHINGKRASDVGRLQQALAQRGGGSIILTVIDVNTGDSHRWRVRPARVWAPVVDD